MEFSTLNRHKQLILVNGYIRTAHSRHVPQEIMTLCYIFFNGDDLETYIEKLKKCELISRSQVFYLCTKLKEILCEESNIININITDNNKYIIVGDVRAQFYDLTVGIFDQFGYPSDDENSTKYIFLGDYTSKGEYHTETLLLLFALKARYPSKIILQRGHHDSRQMSQMYGFFDDAMRKYGAVDIWTICNDVFDYLPLCSLINNKIFTVSGGLSPSIDTLDQISLIDRLQEIPHDGAIVDLLWSCPEENINGTNDAWGISPKGAGYLFGGSAVTQFFDKNQIQLLIRSCTLEMNGYKWMFDNKVLHIFSAPNFAYRCGNDGAVAIVDKDCNVEVVTFKATPDEKRPVKNNGVPAEYWL